jgi:cytochrome oxidase Cu insertion factor (SCO1/SenC/PrrC family)
VQPPPQPTRPLPRGGRRRRLAPSLLVAAILVGVALTGCGGSGARTIAVNDAPSPKGFAAAAVLTPAKTAADFALADQHGRIVRLSDYRGRAVILTFLYTRCGDVCPLIVGKLRQALSLLGHQARGVQMIGISVDRRRGSAGSGGAGNCAQTFGCR